MNLKLIREDFTERKVKDLKYNSYYNKITIEKYFDIDDRTLLVKRIEGVQDTGKEQKDGLVDWKICNMAYQEVKNVVGDLKYIINIKDRLGLSQISINYTMLENSYKSYLRDGKLESILDEDEDR